MHTSAREGNKARSENLSDGMATSLIFWEQELNLVRDLLISTRAAAMQSGPPGQGALVGFDGFVDTIVRAVDKRFDFDNYKPIETIAAFGERISRAAGLSTNIEFVPFKVKLGGNGPIMSNALRATGIRVTYIGSLGKESIHPVFHELAEGATIYSIADPGQTDALEFTDGKLMLGKIESMKDVTWQAIVDAVGIDGLKRILAEVDLVALVNWTMLPHMTRIWRHLTDEILPTLPVRTEKPWFFVDLADPEKRRPEELVEAVEHLKQFNSHFRTVLGLNRKEATEVSNALQISMGAPAAEAELSEIVPAIAERLGVYGVVVHPTDSAACLLAGEYAEVKGPHTSRPFLTTGAGDNFNAGFCLGLTLGLPPRQALVMGTATSGFYVRKGHSPNWNELMEFLQVWADHVGEEF